MWAKDGELQVKTRELQDKERDLVAVRERREELEREQQDLVVGVQTVCNQLGVGVATAPVQRALLIPPRVTELTMARAQRIMQRVLGIIVAHYPNLDRRAIREGWPEELSDRRCDAAEAGVARLARRVTFDTTKDLGLVEGLTRDDVDDEDSDDDIDAGNGKDVDKDASARDE